MPDDALFSQQRRSAAADRPAQRSFLFLQGPLSDFFDRLGRALLARGHKVHRINLHLGDRAFWKLPATDFRGRLDDWRPFLAEFLDRHRITDLILLGDRRPYHLIAAEEARARGIAVICTELGYLRPDWLTVEYDGMSTYSRFPRDPAAIRELARQFPEPDLVQRFSAPFSLLAKLDVIYQVSEVFGRPLYPFYRRHAIYHPFAEYAGWVTAMARRRLQTKATQAAKVQLQAKRASYFLFPLQLATDYQIRAHSPFADARVAVQHVIASFARGGSDRKLVLVVHPLDNGLLGWRRVAMKFARQYGIADKVEVLDGGIPGDVLRESAGVVTINSTVGVTALQQGVPVAVLGNAVFDVPGLTYQGDLDGFWHEPPPPDPELMADFMQALAGATQVKGGFYEPQAQAHAIEAIIARLEQGLYPLPELGPAELAARPVRESTLSVVVTGATGGIGRAVARQYAGPGVRLCLVGPPGRDLAATALDCQRRGAAVHTVPADPRDSDAIAADLAAFDREQPVDILVVRAALPESRGPRQAARLTTIAMLRPDLTREMTSVCAVIDAMRQRRQGRIALVSALPEDPRLADSAELRAFARSLRRQLQGENVAVSVACPMRDASPAALNLDRAARLLKRGVERGRKVIPFEGPVAATANSLLGAPSGLAMWTKEMVAGTDPSPDLPDERPLRRGSGSAD